MIDAIILAGKDEKRHLTLNKIWTKLYSTLDGQNYLWDEYKAIRNISPDPNNSYIPLFLPVVKTLKESSYIDNIVMIGRKEELEDALERSGEGIDIDIIQQVGSIGENAIAAYNFLEANGKHVLIVPHDMPKLYRRGAAIRKPEVRKKKDKRLKSFERHQKSILEKFIDLCLEENEFKHDIYMALTSEECLSTIPLKRHYLRAIPHDNGIGRNIHYIDKRGRVGLKECNLVIANDKISKEKINNAYSMRKLYSLFRARHFFGRDYSKEILGDFLRKRVRIERIEEVISDVLNVDFKFIELYGDLAKYAAADVDSKEDLKAILNSYDRV